jgi:hypothetical protein
MIRFVDITDAYWTDAVPEPKRQRLAAFVSTSDDTFLRAGSGAHIFHDLEEIAEHNLGHRMLALVPDGFFDRDLDDHVATALKAYLAVLDDRPRMDQEYPAGTCNAEDAWRDYDAREKAAMARIRELVS